MSAQNLERKQKKMITVSKHANTSIFAIRSLMHFLDFAKVKETWTGEKWLSRAEKNHRSKRSLIEAR